jgi:hypothetical protein
MLARANARLRSAIALLASVVCLLGSSSPVFAVATEHFGNDPVPNGFLQVGPDVLAVANLKSRIYWREVNGDPMFFYQGDTAALHEALRRFSKLTGDVREVVFLPGPGQARSLTGDRRFACDWYVHTPAGDSEGGPPTMTVYVSAVAPVTPPDMKQLERWIADLDSNLFTTRARASRELEKLGSAAAPALRKALTARPSAEVRRAIEQLLARLKGVDIREVKLPRGVTFLELKDLLKRHRAGLKTGDAPARGHAALALGGLGAYTDVVPDLVSVLKPDNNEYVRRCAVSALCGLGKKAAPALPILKAGLKDPDVNVRNAFAYAVKHIEGAKDETIDEETARRQRVLLDGISAFRKSQIEDSKK